MAASPKKSKKKSVRTLNISRVVKPENLSLEEWQILLRKYDGENLKYQVENAGLHPVFSDFLVMRPETALGKDIPHQYRVAIRGAELGVNFCTCPDFAVNNLGTCKHIEFLLARLRKKRGVPSLLKKGFSAPYSSVSLKYGSQRAVKLRLGTEAPDDFRGLCFKYFGPDGSLPPSKYGHFSTFLEQAAALSHDFRCYDDVLGFLGESADSRHREEILDAAYPEGQRLERLQNLLKVPLLPYQTEGVFFAVRSGRAILADDMGLGKTIQAIGAVELLHRDFGLSKVLVITPSSVKYQWKTELVKFADREANIIEGDLPRRQKLYAEPHLFHIASYDVVFRDLEAIRAAGFGMIILDEAQRIKNWETRTSRVIKSIKTPYALLLTGTPLENKLEELLSVVQYVDPFLLGPTHKFLDTHQVKDETGKVLGYKNLHQISKVLSPILLRRTKKEILRQLPPRSDRTILLPLTKEQSSIHEEQRQTVSQIVSKWRRMHFLSDIDRLRLQKCLMIMRMVCDSTYLVDETQRHGKKAGEIQTLLEEILNIKEERVVIFTQWLKMAELIEDALKSLGEPWIFLHGGLSSKERGKALESFQSPQGPRVFLSTEAGGVGLNLQTASHLLNVDLPWNPAKLEQRIGRIHRMGQKSPVQIINLVAADSIEHQILGLIAFKKEVSVGILDGGMDTVMRDGSQMAKLMEELGGMVEGPAAPLEEEAAAEPAPEEEETIVINVYGEEGELSLASEGVELEETLEEEFVLFEEIIPSPPPQPAAHSTHQPAPQSPALTLNTLFEWGRQVMADMAAPTAASVTATEKPARPRVHQDLETGEVTVRLPPISPEVIDAATTALNMFLKSLTKG